LSFGFRTPEYFFTVNPDRWKITCPRLMLNGFVFFVRTSAVKESLADELNSV
jgi:hypothetical protein